MICLPSARRWAILGLLLVLLLTVVLRQWPEAPSRFLDTVLQVHTQRGMLVTVRDAPDQRRAPGDTSMPSSGDSPFHHCGSTIPPANPRVASLQHCTGNLNPYIKHVRLPEMLHNIVLTPQGDRPNTSANFFNPAILPLPHWSGAAKYLLIARRVTSGFHQEAHGCLADICRPQTGSAAGLSPDIRPCTSSDLEILGPAGGMQCVSAAVTINIPPTPAALYIPGFHDPRVFWSGKGEPLILVNSASKYGCVGLWMVDLRTLLPDLKDLLGRQREENIITSELSVISYPHLTEITRNPRSSRASIEKNWVLWFPTRDEAYVQYDFLDRTIDRAVDTRGPNVTNATRPPLRDAQRQGGRAFAKLLGNGFTTPNLTHHAEDPCFGRDTDRDSLGQVGHWHQGSNALRLILCTRVQVRHGVCGAQDTVASGTSVHLAIVHRKFSNELHLPLRYERYVMVWESRPPFQVLGVSRWPLVMGNERANPWSEAENWPAQATGWNETHVKRFGGVRSDSDAEAQDSFPADTAYFAYTPSLAWAWRPSSAGLGPRHLEEDVEHVSQLGTGYLGDEVIMGVGLDDVRQAYAKVKVDSLLQCLRLCPGVRILRDDD